MPSRSVGKASMTSPNEMGPHRNPSSRRYKLLPIGVNAAVMRDSGHQRFAGKITVRSMALVIRNLISSHYILTRTKLSIENGDLPYRLCPFAQSPSIVSPSPTVSSPRQFLSQASRLLFRLQPLFLVPGVSPTANFLKSLQFLGLGLGKLCLQTFDGFHCAFTSRIVAGTLIGIRAEC